jgi:hypothetical protein
MSIAIVNLVEVAISPGIVADVADGDGRVVAGRDTALAFQSGAAVTLSLGLLGGSTANAPAEKVQSPRETAACRNKIRMRIDSASSFVD